jgi:hypothetical protein
LEDYIALPATNSGTSWILLLVGLTLLRGLLYLSIFPPFLAPDESAHVEAIRLIGQEKKWPTAEVYAVTPMHPEMVSTFEKFRIWQLVGLYSPTRSLDVTSNLFIDYYPAQIAGSEVVADSYLMLYHVTLAPLSALIAPLDLTTQVYILRSVSVLFAAVTIVVVWLTLRAIFPADQGLALAVVAFVLFWPMRTHINAAVTVDALVEMLACLWFWMLIQIFLKGASLVRVIMLLGLLGLAIVTKPTALFLFPTLIVSIIIYASRIRGWPVRVVGGSLVFLVLATFMGAILLHQNSDGGRKILSLSAITLSLPDWSRYLTPAAVSRYISALNFAVLSFGGLFGWSNIHIPWVWVRIWAVFLSVISPGVLMFIYHSLLKKNLSLSQLQRELLLILLLALVFSLTGVVTPIIVTQSPSWGIHSRYYFPAIIPVALYFYNGFRQLVPGRWRSLALPAWVVGWIAYDTVTLVWVILPYVYS